ncbi:hypothetical protein SAMN05660895_1061 [Thermoflavifilum thermophilum]|uniref:Uncharacterized protein n=1 Tax=Thermoflavifilum thermophilum TaxID=1393122 RepID=A0A1I7NA19_9BACT|nr:hypothetical protein SAMN05660895_1061 [Thermoflavifilum thermophilum]
MIYPLSLSRALRLTLLPRPHPELAYPASLSQACRGIFQAAWDSCLPAGTCRIVCTLLRRSLTSFGIGTRKSGLGREKEFCMTMTKDASHSLGMMLSILRPHPDSPPFVPILSAAKDLTETNGIPACRQAGLADARNDEEGSRHDGLPPSGITNSLPS